MPPPPPRGGKSMIPSEVMANPDGEIDHWGFGQGGGDRAARQAGILSHKAQMKEVKKLIGEDMETRLQIDTSKDRLRKKMDDLHHLVQATLHAASG